MVEPDPEVSESLEPPHAPAMAKASATGAKQTTMFFKGSLQEISKGAPILSRSAGGAPRRYQPSRRASVGKNRGFVRSFVACSNAYAIPSSVGSLYAPAKNEIPIGSPCRDPAGTVMLG